MKKFKKFLRNKNNYPFIVVLILIVVVGFFLSRPSKNEPPIQKGQIQIKKGNQIVTVNENGLVEYRSDEGVFYENWDSAKTNSFFTSMELAARRYLADPPKNIPQGAYEVTLWIDGKIVTIYITEDDDESGVLDDVFSDFDNGGGGGSDDGDLSDYFGDNGDTGGGSGGGSVSSPTPTVANQSSSPTPTIINYAGQGGGGEQIPPDCDLYGTSVNNRTVISNTICQIEEN